MTDADGVPLQATDHPVDESAAAFPAAELGVRGWLRITHERKGFRDVHWCSLMNEPFVLRYKTGTNERACEFCHGDWDEDNHPFLCHIQKGQHGTAADAGADAGAGGARTFLETEYAKRRHNSPTAAELVWLDERKDAKL